jgi:hypothetical protein
MNLALFGGFGTRPLAPGGQKETALALLGGGELDLTSAPPGENSSLTAVAILGGIKILVAPGSRVTMSGVSLFGGRQVKLKPGDGPEIRVRAVAVLGGVEVTEPSAGGD